MTPETEQPLDWTNLAELPDPLTGLADRHQFARRLGTALSDADPEQRRIALFAINLDGFRRLNTLHGCAVGDQVLKLIAERLVAETAGTPGTVARLGGDEFVVMCGPPSPSGQEVREFASRLAQLIERPMTLGARSLRLSAGIACMTTVASQCEADDALRDLDLAMRRAKALGPGRIVGWEPALTSRATRQYSLTEDLRRAVDNGELVLHYQPVLRLADERMVGAEVLLRWNHPSEGLVASASFVPVLEQTGLIVETGAWIIREAMRQVESWRLLYGRDIVDWISVNLSARQIDDPEPLLASLRAIDGGRVSTRRLRIEIAEPALMRNRSASRAVVDALDRLGIGLQIDDFGTGASALASLRHFPVETVKIDGGFTAQIGTAEGETQVRALLDIARMRGAAVVAEGIEAPAERDFLIAGGCEFGQGYLFAEPMDGALLGAYALTHAVAPHPLPVRARPAIGLLNPAPSSRSPLRAS
jgi:diguanylate cyclase (GGDEF)-like protein